MSVIKLSRHSSETTTPAQLQPNRMRFRGQTGPQRFLNRRDQRRLLLLVTGLFLIFFAIQLAGKPDSWAWFLALSHRIPGDPAAGKKPLRSGFPRKIQLSPGGFRLVGPQPQPLEADSRQQTDSPSRINSQIFESVRDNSLGVRSSEREAYFAVLAKARDFDPTTAKPVTVTFRADVFRPG